MIKPIAFAATLTLLSLSSLAMANQVTVCTHDSATREIHVVYEVEGQSVPCRVDYVKSTGTQSLWRAEGVEGYCEEKASTFVAKQESWGWSCESQAASTETAETVDGGESADMSAEADAG